MLEDMDDPSAGSGSLILASLFLVLLSDINHWWFLGVIFMCDIGFFFTTTSYMALA